MKNIPDDVPLSNINLPGTHDSATAHVSFALFARCQSLDIAGQLEAGCRFLDLRLSGEDASLPMVHGMANCRRGRSPFSGRLLFADVLRDCYDFLGAHPSETIMALVKDERSGGAQFVKYFYNAIADRPERWFLESRMPTLGEVRGKLVLLRRFADPEGTLDETNGGLLLGAEDESLRDGAVRNVYLTKPDGGRVLTAKVQDEYLLPPGRKWEASRPLLEGGAGESASFNFLSTAWLVCPRLTSAVINKKFMSAGLKKGVRTGVTGFDFLTRAAAEKIIATNAPEGASLYLFETDHSLIDCGMCLILRCEDGAFIVIDSAHALSANDHVRLHDFMRERTPQGDKILITGWFLTHCHDDHVKKFMDFIDAGFDDVDIEKIYYNFAPLSCPDAEKWRRSEREVLNDFACFSHTHPELDVQTLRTGMRFTLHGVAVEVLCTWEDFEPGSMTEYNFSSTVFDMRVCGTRILITGDAGGEQDMFLLTKYGDALKSDIVQVSHHGHAGLSEDFYRAVSAEVALFPTTQIFFDADLSREANRAAIDLCREYHVSSNGTAEIPLPYIEGRTRTLPDETFENFDEINRLWGYEYSEDRKQQLRARYERSRK